MLTHRNGLRRLEETARAVGQFIKFHIRHPLLAEDVVC
jgi:hypothetical protein